MDYNKILRGINEIGVVCDDGSKLSPVVVVLLRDFAIRSSNKNVRSMKFYNAGYKRGKEITNSAKGFLQQEGFQTTSDFLELDRVDFGWIQIKDIILVMDKFLKRKIFHDYGDSNIEIEKKVFIFNEFVGINQKIRDPGDEFVSSENKELFLLLKKCCQIFIKMLEKAN